MPTEGIVNVPVSGLGEAVELIEYAACLASGGDVFSCSPIGELVDLFAGLFEGVPKMLKTEEAQARLAQSTLPQFRQLAANLMIWVRNGVPLSTGNPTYRAQLSNWISGTIYRSGLGLRVTPQGYDQFSAVDTTLWRVLSSQYAYSGKALDTLVHNFQGVNRLLDQQPKPPPPPPPPGGPGRQVPPPGSTHPPPPPPPPPPPEPQTACTPVGPDIDETMQSCIATQRSLGAIIALLEQQQGAGQTAAGGTDKCCAAVVAAIAGVTNELTVIATAMAESNSSSPGLDLTAITEALQQLVAAVAAYPPALQACCSAITTQLSGIATAVATAPGTDVSKIVEQLKDANALELLPKEFVDVLVKEGTIPPELAQLFSARPWHWSIAGIFHSVGKFVIGGINPDLGKEVSQNLKDHAAGRPDTYQPIHSLLDVVVALVMNVGYHWSNWGVSTSQLLKPAVLAAFDDLGAALKAGDPTIGKDLPLAVGWPAVAAIKFVMSAPPPGELVTTANYTTVAQDAFGRAALLGFVAYGVAMVSGWLFGPFAKGMEEVAALVALGSGFEEISKVWIGPFLDAIIAHRARQDANTKWPTQVPSGPQGLALFARRKIGQAEADELQGYAGLDPTWRPAMYAGAFRPVTPFVLASAFVDQPIDRATLLDILQDNAYSNSHANTMADALLYKSIANVRNSYLSALISGYQKGVVDDAELDQALTDFNFSPQAKQYVTSHVLIQRREVLAAMAIREVVPLVANGNITPEVGLQQLEAAGVLPWLANLEITFATTKADIHAARLEAAAERKLELERQRNLTRTAIAEFARGALDLTGLTAALIAVGLDPTLVASIVAVQDATRTGRLKWLYGQLLAPREAAVLRDQVAAIGQQTKDQLLTLDQAEAQLLALKVDRPEAQALIARWAAALKKSPGASRLVTP